MGAPFVEVAETHSGVVFFVGDRAYKLKKRLDLGFLDFTRRSTREAVCHREVELNRRLAPDVYLGVADVIGPDREIADHLVVMRRLPASSRLSVRAVADDPTLRPDLRLIARQLAAFHARARTGPDIDLQAGSQAVMDLWEVGAEEVARLNSPALDTLVLSRALRLARRYVEGRRSLFEARIAGGRVCDGHGDLLADDIFCLPDGPRILDCIEFDDRLRYGDVLSDIAFLAMDLERLGRTDLAGVFLGAYREITGDTWPTSLEHHYIAYRAFVRAKVSALRAEQLDGDTAEQAGRLLSLAVAHLEAGRVRLILIGGLPGTGKSTMATAVADATGAVVIGSDEIRKQQAGLDITVAAADSYLSGLYRTGVTLDTYRTLFERARVSLERGVSVVLDASFHDPAMRAEAVRLAGRTLTDLDQVECVAPMRLIEERIRTRGAAGPSDASVEVARAMQAEQTEWPEAVHLDTEGSIGAVRRHLLAELVGGQP